MAKSNAVWGIDIGHCALKAICCRPHETDDNRIVAEAFDYIEYPKILTQPEANREELIRDALQQFIERNDLTDMRVAISVPGQNGLTRFIKLPPVEAKKIPDIVKYEARQQIPFSLEDVVWDYQPLAGESPDDEIAMGTEVGLFAMKRDQVAKALQPLDDAGIAVDIIQLAPLALYNYACFDRMNNLEGMGSFDPANPPDSTVMISLGTDTTDLVITNGFRVWQRNIPIGGSHFTKSLTKEMKLTFSKAEHLKRNANQAKDTKAVFQAMRPIFSDLLAEIQRSIGYFNSIEKNAKLVNSIALGNPMKLPGLQRYLSQNLDTKVVPIEQFNALVGGSVTDGKVFQENLLSFPVAYGLCIQALGLAQISTNLLPEEIVTSRLIKAKKPWAVAAAAVLMGGLAINYVGHYMTLTTADVESSDMKSAMSASDRVSSSMGTIGNANTELKDKFTTVEQVRENLVSNIDGRLVWLELLKAVGSALPKDTRPEAEREQSADDVTQRNEVHITSIDCQEFRDVNKWFRGVQAFHTDAQHSAESRLAAEAEAEAEAANALAPGETPPGNGTAEGAVEDNAEGATDEVGEDEQFNDPEPDGFDDGFDNDGGFDDEEGVEGIGTGPGPHGPGMIVQLIGHHFHNSDPTRKEKQLIDRNNEGGLFVRKTIIKKLIEGSVQLPDAQGNMIEVPIAELGISYPLKVTAYKISSVTYDPNAENDEDAKRFGGGGGFGEDGFGGGFGNPMGSGEEVEAPELWKLRRYDFIIQFCWQPETRSQRAKNAAAAEPDVEETASLETDQF